MEPVVVVEGLKKSFGDVTVLDGVDMAFPEGEITSIIGQSGTGKSVLIKHVIGIMKPDAGTVWYRNENIFAATPERQTEIRQRFGYLFQNSALFDSLTVEENIAFPLVESLRIKDKQQDRTNDNGKARVDWVA